MAECTPGPWRARFHGRMPNGVAMYWLKDQLVSIATVNKADADLAAAAPALLRSLIECADDLEAELKDRWGDDPRVALKLERDMQPVYAARAAIASATGEQPA